ncbi:uncharacterized protein LOC123513539 [Portunus trituberculatus]|uniref:uncharacterized protein LOC123513539 n=1 Tax=Portunus trituberculatus TaxID=210409 RepID=UPI001E1D10D4|nr:uncharacterized protein LOC123513539 [Portunus trituberculatus]
MGDRRPVSRILGSVKPIHPAMPPTPTPTPCLRRRLVNATRRLAKVFRALMFRKQVPAPPTPFPHRNHALMWSYEEAQNAHNARLESHFKAAGGSVLTLPFCYVEWAV